MRDPGEATPASDLILYQTEDGKTRIQCRFVEENIWLSQAQIGDLYQKDVKTINEHLPPTTSKVVHPAATEVVWFFWTAPIVNI
jgi:hypothetical protein